MAEPFVFHFKAEPTGAPQVMYMADLDCACELCGHGQIQRFYHSTPFHSLTLPDLESLADNLADKADYECENCAAAVGPHQVRRTALTYGFADDAGTICLFNDGNRRQVVLSAHRRLDPQAMPRFEADSSDDNDDDRLVLDDEAPFDEETIEDFFDRPFNVKLAWRDLLSDYLDDPEGGAFSRVSPGLWIVIDATEEAAADLMEEIDDGDFWEAYDNGDLAVISLHDSVPHRLPTATDAAGAFGRWQTWLPDDIVDAVTDQTLWADAYISRTAAVDTIARTLTVGQLSFEQYRSDADLFFNNMSTPSDVAYRRPLPLSSVLRRAVYTGITPGESARLTTEEIVADLLGLW